MCRYLAIEYLWLVSQTAVVIPANRPPECEVHHDGTDARLESISVAESQRMGEFFAVLGDPTRLRLISLLADEELCVCDLARQIGISESAASHQMRALRASRLVAYRKEGRQVFYSLHDHHVLDLYRTVREHLAEP